MSVRAYKKSGEADYLLLSYFILLLLFGLIMLTSASSVTAFDRFGDTYFFIKRQLLYGVTPGIIAFFVFSKLSYPTLKKAGMAGFYISIALLVAVLIPGVGSTLNTGARSWLIVAGFSLQPAELVKLGMIFFLAHQLSVRKNELQDLKQGFLVVLGLGLVPVGLVVLQPDIGTASILFAIVFGMLFIARAKMAHLGGLAAVAMIAFMILIAVAPYRAARFTTFLHPELDPQGIGYHINQAFLAIGSGGWIGLGLGHSQQKFQYLPEVHADSIFAVIAEETGFIVTTGIIVLLILLSLRGLQVAKEAGDEYSRLLAGGIIIWLATQSFFNIGAMVGLMPLTGVPLPFVSHGGSALAIAMASVGVLINISRK
ncbi:MAG: putative lipid II flippase FtsW [Candidatus Magasanikbacteria bacterium CG10_big_fil_rev_8_21_14_0_10_43_6]|uniref:Probable peptidoglycan glycosyltransferase FtsW n=1 Tax=Candidatus Magasanikbacteria bacterium CG10_big_fil_rev_8_21_14_0_10_43_6 TaxID=1974650 RepID=A0A2M6W0F0_9BACT|nr:MAG: putative lipid II flippase FtsW [Candidatus Magasanikbacteria bacterium CG10_big_fil_rev_8_21_14_0_10_43_6]